MIAIKQTCLSHDIDISLESVSNVIDCSSELMPVDKHSLHTATYLLGQPLFSDELEEGFNEPGLSY